MPLPSLAASPLTPLHALAGEYHLEAVAVAASAHVRALDTATLADVLMRRMGAGYLARLRVRDEMRRGAVKAIVMRPPRGHEPTGGCGEEQQRALQRAWAVVAAELGWEEVPGECMLVYATGIWGGCAY